jgi:hypothetical protein
MPKFLAGFLTLVSFFGCTWLRAFVLLRYWAWFVVPLGLPTATIVQAIGVTLMIQLLSIRRDNYESKRPMYERITAEFCWSITVSLCAWVTGAVWCVLLS